jgi:hypothetical protein
MGLFLPYITLNNALTFTHKNEAGKSGHLGRWLLAAKGLHKIIIAQWFAQTRRWKIRKVGKKAAYNGLRYGLAFFPMSGIVVADANGVLSVWVF